VKLVDLERARELMLAGEVVAIPTETVYGLGGWIRSTAGLRKIFSQKERPFFDPLIVHVDGIESARKLTSEWTEAHETLAKTCWPGPLTLIARKADAVDPLITSGLDSVGLRCPDHPVTLRLLGMIEGGIAAPSANKFGKTSPTTSRHVFEEFGDAVAILEGGPCRVGIESTVAGISRKEDGTFEVQIFRPGHFTATRLREILAGAGIAAKVDYAASPVAPGQLQHHYMPRIPLVIIPSGFRWEECRLRIEKKLARKFERPAIWTQPEDPRLASRELYQRLREFDQLGHDLILTAREASHDSEDWQGIWNRLEKAKSLVIDE
jgi:L-threonylcarbamoyladenylate synthase